MNQHPSWSTQQQLQSSSKISLPRTTGRVTLKIILYFVGSIIAEFGFIGGSSGKNVNTTLDCLALSIGVFGLIGSIFLFFRKEYYLHCLPRVTYLWLILGASGTFVVLFGILFGTTNPQTNPVANITAICIVMLYGISLMWIAHLKPPIAQQINESIYRLVKKMPGRQLVVSDLLAHLKKKYKCSDASLNQYIDNLEYIEVISVLGTPGIVCRMKSQKPTHIASPRKTIRMSDLINQIRKLPLNKLMASLFVLVNSLPHHKPKLANIPVVAQKTTPILPIVISGQNSAVQSSKSLNSQATNQSVSTPNQTIASVQSSPNQTILPILWVANNPAPVVNSPAPVVNSPAAPIVLTPNNPAVSSSSSKPQTAISIFCCYAHEDEQLLEKLKTHLKPLQRQGLIQIWYDRNILAGAAWEQEIEEQLNTAQIILLLVSPDFIASDYCYTKEMGLVLEKHARGQVYAVPIILRPIDWLITPLGKLQALPTDGKPITTWTNRDAAYLDVARGIRTIVETFLNPSLPSKKSLQPQNSVQKIEQEVELFRTRCSKGKIIITSKKVIIELRMFGSVLQSQTLLRTSLIRIDSKLIIPSVLGMGGGTDLTFYGRGREVLKAELIPPKDAQEILAWLR